MRSTFLALIASLPLVVACGDASDGKSTPPTERSSADPRDAWQKPEVLMEIIGTDLGGMTVADLFAGDGYFTFRLAGTGANVIAIVNDPSNAAKIEERRAAEGLSEEQVQVRIVPEGDPGLAPNEVDMALLVHHFVTIEDRDTYFRLLRRGMRSPRPLFMVEWQKGPTQLGPPPDQRMVTETIMDELGHHGFTDVGAFSDKLPDQVLLFASDPMEILDEGMPNTDGAPGQ